MKIIKKTVLIIILAAVLFAAVCKTLEALYPVKYADEISRYADEYNLDYYFVLGLIKAESNFDTYAHSKKDAMGLMQLTEETAHWIAGKMNLGNIDEKTVKAPETNIKMGCFYLSYLNDMYGGNTESVLAAYNAGFNNVDKWLSDKNFSDDGINLKKVPYPETERYINKVKNNYRMYRLVAKIQKILKF